MRQRFWPWNNAVLNNRKLRTIQAWKLNVLIKKPCVVLYTFNFRSKFEWSATPAKESKETINYLVVFLAIIDFLPSYTYHVKADSGCLITPSEYCTKFVKLVMRFLNYVWSILFLALHNTNIYMNLLWFSFCDHKECLTTLKAHYRHSSRHNGVRTTLYRRWCDVKKTLKWRPYNVVLTLCAGWDSTLRRA